MKQYLTPEQTAKLIELGFDRPKNRVIKQLLDRSTSSWITIGEEGDYSIGEVIAMIPPSYSDKWKGDCYLIIRHDSVFWFVGYIVSGARKPHIRLSNIELIDVLYDMILKLKEEEII